MKKYIFLFIIILTTHFSFGQSVTTVAASSITQNTATLNASTSGLTSGKKYRIEFYYDTSSGGVSNSAISDEFTASSGNTSHSFTADISELSSGIKYYFTAYLYEFTSPPPSWTHKASGSELDFTTTSLTSPTVTTNAASNIAQTTATLNGEVTADGGAAITARGVCYSTTTSPDLTDSYTTGGTTVDSYSHGVTGLTAGTTYYIRAYATNSEGTSYGSETNFKTLKNAPTAQASAVTFSSVASTTMTVDWTRAGTNGGDYCLVVAEAGGEVNSPSDGTDYTASSAFGSGTPSIGGTGTSYVIYKGTGTTVDVTGLTAGTSYTFKVFEFNNTGSNTKYYISDGTDNPDSQTTLNGEPTTQTTTITFSNIQTNQLTATASGGNGSYRIILAKQGSAVNGVPVDGTEYTGNSSFGSGAQIGTGNYIVFAGSGSAVTVTNLLENTHYYLKVFEYNNTGSNTNYKTDGFSINNPNDTITPKSTPSSQATNLTFSNITNNGLNISWTRGNGDSIMIVAKAGSSLTETPTTGTAYEADANFGDGNTIATDCYVVYTGTGTNISITGLAASSEYTFRAFEFNNAEPYTNYLTSTNSENPASQYTVGSQPTTQAKDISFTNVQSNQVSLSWTDGNGSNRVVLAHINASIDSNPVDGFAYTANSVFGSGDEIGTDNFVVYNGSGSGVIVTNLLPDTVYYFKVFEYNGTGTATNYFTDNGTSGNPSSQRTAKGEPNTQASNIVYSAINTTSYTISWTSTDGDSVLVVGKAGSTLSETPTDGTSYHANSVFGSGETIASGCSVVYNGNGTSVSVTGLTANSNYTFKVFAFNKVSGGAYYQDADATNNPLSRYTLATEPSNQAGSITFSNKKDTQVDLTWTRNAIHGDGVIVLASEVDITSYPADGTGYNSSNIYKSGDAIGSHYVVFNSSGTTATITGLTPNTKYYFRAFEYNGSNTSCNYLTSTGTSDSTTTLKAEPDIQANSISFTNINTTTYTVNWVRGNTNYNGVIIVARQGSAVADIPKDGTPYTANAAYGTTAAKLGTGYVVYNGTGTTVNVTSLSVGTEYHFRAFEYNNSGSDIDYFTETAADNPNSQYTLDNEPTTQVTSFSTGTVGSNNIPLSWTVGNGTGRIVLAKEGSAVSASAIPVDTTNYTANTTFGSGDEIGSGNFVVYAGSGTSVDVTGLLGNTDYYFQIFEYNNNGAINYRTSDGPTAHAKTGEKSAPTVQVSSIYFSSLNSTSFTINWKNGNGEKRIVTMKEATTGSPTPTNNITYAASTDWSNKTGPVSDGFYTLYNGTDTTVSITNLTANTTYRVQIFEYNNSSGAEKYNTSTATDNPANQTTLKAAPSTQASAISLTNKTSTSFTVNWTNGNGDNRIVVARLTNSSNVTPTDLTNYTANTTFGSGDPTGSGNYVVYNGTGSTVAVSGLTTSTSYTFVIYDYNNSSTNAIYNTSITDDINSKDSTTLGPVTWDGSTDTDWNTAANWTPSGVPTSSYSVIIADVTNQPVVGANNSVEHLTVNAGAWLTINDGYTLSVAGDVTLKSPSGNGPAGQIVIPGSGVLSVSGNSKMERYYPTTTNWRLVSSPLTSPSIANWTGYYVNAYNEPDASWDYLNSNSTVSVMQGVSVKNSSGSSSISFSGTFNTGSKSISVTNSSTGDVNYGWNIVGNPYPSAVDWTSSGITKTNVDVTAYIYNSANGSYITCNASTCTPGTENPIIAAGQGFFIHATANGFLAFSNSARTASSQTFRKNGIMSFPKIRLQADNGIYTSEALIMFDKEATEDFDSEFDAYKLLSTNDTISDIYTLLDEDTYLSINALNTDVLTNLPSEGFIIPLGLTKGYSGLITLSAYSLENISESVYIYLYDIQENKYTNLRSSSYELFIDSQSDNRFQLILSPTALKIDETKNLNNNILIYTYKKTTFVKSDIFESNTGNIHIYDITGKLIASKTTINSSVQEFYINEPGTYIIKVIINNYVVTQKVVVK